jgi:hypothetical protein
MRPTKNAPTQENSKTSLSTPRIRSPLREHHQRTPGPWQKVGGELSSFGTVEVPVRPLKISLPCETTHRRKGVHVMKARSVKPVRCVEMIAPYYSGDISAAGLTGVGCGLVAWAIAKLEVTDSAKRITALRLDRNTPGRSWQASPAVTRAIRSVTVITASGALGRCPVRRKIQCRAMLG